MDRRAALRLADLAQSQHGVFTREQARRAGVDPWRIEGGVDRGQLVRVAPSIYRIAGTPPGHLQDLMVAVLAVGPEAVASHQAAAWLWELTDRFELHVATTRSRWRHRTYQVHRSTDLYGHHVVRVRGVPVTTPARTVVDLGATAPLAVVARAFDAALRAGITTVEDVAGLVEEVARPGRRGVGAARKLIGERVDLTVATESVLEGEFARLLHENGLPPPTPQFELRDRQGRVIARVDFAYPDHRVAIELDGYRFHSDPHTFATDRQRQNLIALEGFTVLRYTARDVRGDPGRILSEIRGLVR